MIPTCTTWSAFQDMGGPISQGPYKRYHQYLEAQRRSASTTSGDPDAGDTDPRTPQPPKKPQINLEIAVVNGGSHLETRYAQRVGLPLDHYE